MKTTTKITIFLILLVLIVSANAFAQRGPGRSRGWHRGPADANAPGPHGFGQWAPRHQGQRGQFGPGSRGRGFDYGPHSQFDSGSRGRGFGPGPHGQFHSGPRGRGFGPGPQEGSGRGFPMLQILRRLDLTEDQWEEVKTVLNNKKEDAEVANKAVRDAQKALHEAVINEAGEEVIRTAAAGVGRAIGDQAVLKTQAAASVKAVLTEEQLQKLENIKGKMQELQEDMQALRGELGPGQNRRGAGFGPKSRYGTSRRGMRGHRPPGPPPMHPQW